MLTAGKTMPDTERRSYAPTETGEPARPGGSRYLCAPSMTEDTCYSAASHVSVRLLKDGGALLFDSDRNRERYLNSTGYLLWQGLDGSCSAAELVNLVRSSCDCADADPVGEDIRSFLDDLCRQGLARACPRRQAARRETKGVAPGIDDAPKSLDISLTGTCNLRCRYCFYDDDMRSRSDLPTTPWLTFFDELQRLSVQSVCLSGGEVFTRSDLWDLIDGLVARNLRYSILTNGTLIDEAVLSAFRAAGRADRLNSIQVSLDGSRAEVNDRSRGAGSFDKAVRGLRLLKEAGLPVTVRVTVNRHNAEDLQDVAAFLLDHIGLPAFSTNDAMPVGAGCRHKDSIALLPSQRMKAMTTLAALDERYPGRLQAQAGPLANWRFFRDMERARATGVPVGNRKMGCLSACGCVFHKLAVHHDGVITPCNMLPSLELGRMNEDSLTHIWKTHPALAALKERRNYPMNKAPGCEDCSWATYCNGSCPGLPYEATGNLHRANPHDCYRAFVDQVGRIPMD